MENPDENWIYKSSCAVGTEYVFRWKYVVPTERIRFFSGFFYKYVAPYRASILYLSAL